jgi:hypothetical protein
MGTSKTEDHSHFDWIHPTVPTPFFSALQKSRRTRGAKWQRKPAQAEQNHEYLTF